MTPSHKRNHFNPKSHTPPPVLFMTEYQKILIPTDGSDEAKYAAQRGLALAKLLGSQVTAVHVLEHPHYLGEALSLGEMIPMESPEMKESDMYKGLEKMAENTVNFVKDEGEKMGVDVTTRIIEGHPADEIVKLSGEFDISLYFLPLEDPA